MEASQCLPWLALAHALPPSQQLPSNEHDNHLPLRLRGQNKYDYHAIFRVLTACLVLDKQAAQAIVPSLVLKGLCRNCKRREEAIYTWMRNTLPSAPISPTQQYRKPFRKSAFLIMSLVVVHLS